MANRNISPPPTKRIRLSAPSLLAPSVASRPITPLTTDLLRIFSWNVNGISPFLQPSITSFFEKSPRKVISRSRSPNGNSCTAGRDRLVDVSRPSLTQCLERWKFPSLVCLQEVKIAPSDNKTQQAIRQSVRKCADGVGYTAHFSLPRDRFNARGFGGKVYGVCTLVRDDLLDKVEATQHVKKVDWDLEGRVLVTELRDRMVVVVNVYAVNGTENPYRDPGTGEVVGTRHDRKRVFHSDLAGECARYEEQGFMVVIAGDINIARSPLDGFPGIRLGASHVQNRQDFERKLMEAEGARLGMVDCFRYLHGKERKYTYRSRGLEWGKSCDRVDMILLSGKAVKEGKTVQMWNNGELGACGSTLIEADILDEELERGPSDHVPIYATLCVGRVLTPSKDNQLTSE